MKIGIDLMGSDLLPKDLFQPLLEEFSSSPSLFFHFFAHKKFEKNLSFKESKNYKLHFSKDEIVENTDPLLVLREKQDTSLLKGIHFLKEKEIDVLISGGNTGALIALSSSFLPKFPSIKRPGLLAFLPTKKKEIAVIDVGGSVSVKEDYLFQFGLMGVSLIKLLDSKKIPKMALLNIGHESQKGTLKLKRLYQRLFEKSKTGNFVFLGNKEPKDVFEGDIDVLVTEGFSGNIFLKTAESFASFLLTYVHQEEKNLFNYHMHPGAILLGIDRLIFKCHGSSTIENWISTVRKSVSYHEISFLSSFSKILFQMQ